MPNITASETIEGVGVIRHLISMCNNRKLLNSINSGEVDNGVYSRTRSTIAKQIESTDKSEDEDESESTDKSEDELEDEDKSEDESEDKSEDESEDEYNRPLKYRKTSHSYESSQIIEMMKVQKHILNKQPSALKIILSNASIDNKARMIQLYEVYDSLDIYSEERLELADRLRAMSKSFSKEGLFYARMNKSELDTYNTEKKRLIGMTIDAPLDHQIITSGAPEHIKADLLRQSQNLSTMSSRDDEYHKMKCYIEYAVSLPYNKIITTVINNTFFTNLRQRLDSELYGMSTVKEQIILYVHTRINNPNASRFALTLKGEPGTGKTSIVRLLSDVLNVPLGQVFFGGVNDGRFIRGHEYTYVGAKPGIISKEMIKMGCSNGVMFFDEIDKACQNHDVSSALLQVLDPSQNSNFKDMYFNNISIDLSKVWFILSMNNLPPDPALVDRMFIVEVPGYSHSDKVAIISKHFLPNSLRNEQIDHTMVSISEEGSNYIIEQSDQCPGQQYKRNSSKSGVRSIKKTVEDIVRKISFLAKRDDPEISFYTKIVFPLTLDVDIIQKLIHKKQQPQDNFMESMYM
jgi:ATP-dependent Lon protease